MMWFWQFKVKVIPYEGEKDAIFSGIVVGDTIIDAVKALYDYYGEELIDILGCKAIIDNVFEFETAREDGFDYEVVYAPKNQ